VTEQGSGDSVAQYRPIVESFVAKEPVTAMEMRFVLYDVFNEYITTLAVTRVEDVASAGPFTFKEGLQDFVQPVGQDDESFSRTALDDAKKLGLDQNQAQMLLEGLRKNRPITDRAKAMSEDAVKNPTLFTASAIDAGRLLTVVSFVSRVRSQNGTVWKLDPTAVAAEIGKLLHSQVTETNLVPVGPGH
jgi:hypothetical protein